jgi:hypothetical protein
MRAGSKPEASKQLPEAGPQVAIKVEEAPPNG